MFMLLGSVGSGVFAKGLESDSSDQGSALWAESERLQGLIDQPELARRLGPMAKAKLESRLSACDEALGSGANEIGLRQLARVRLDLDRESFIRKHDHITDLAALQVICEEAKQEGQPKVAWDPMQPRPAALQGLLEVSVGRASRYLGSALDYGSETSVDAGLYYLAVAHSFSNLTRFLVELPYDSPKAHVQALPGLGNYLARLEADVVELYHPPLSVERHSEFTAISATLKFARQLEAEGALTGALELGLDARVNLGRFGQEEEPDLDRLEAPLADIQARMDATQADHSMGRLLLARAERAIAELVMAEEGASYRDALVLVESVLPEYFGCFEGEARGKRGQEQVTVTLVRWPFT